MERTEPVRSRFYDDRRICEKEYRTGADGIRKDSEVIAMWSFQSKRNALHEQLLLAPETNPSEFIRRYLAQKPAQPAPRRSPSAVKAQHSIADRSANSSLIPG